jgi:hypothetical protein
VRRDRILRAARSGAALALLAGLCACVPTQQIALQVAPRGATLWVDGQEHPGPPARIELRSDRDHTLFFRARGHRPELVVLRTTRRGGRSVLEPEEVQVTMTPSTSLGRSLEIEQIEPVE